MIKKILLALSLSFFFSANAQQGTSSAYSFYGIGDVKQQGAAEIRSMGSLAAYQDSLHLNVLNPASYSNLQGTTFSIGASNHSTFFKSGNTKDFSNRFTFDYFALAFPVGKLGVAFGIMPYSFVGYNISNTSEDAHFRTNNNFKGEGGVNQTFLGLSYKIGSRFSFGVNANYIFGDTQKSATRFLRDLQTNTFLNTGTSESIRNDYSGFSYTFGATYVQPLKKDWELTLAATFSPKAVLKHTQSGKIQVVNFSTDGSIQGIGNQREINQKTGNDYLPSKYTFGATIGNPMQWLVGVEYTSMNKADLVQVQNAGIAYQTGSKIAIGGFYTPDYRFFSSYFKRITYRAGAKYEHTGMLFKFIPIKDVSASLGVGIPIGIRQRNFSNLNIGFEFGQRGTTKSNLIQENYINFSIGLSFNDFWFIRRKFD